MLSFLAANWLDIFIVLLLVYLVWGQQKVISSKKEIIQDYKDIPELAKYQASMREDKFKKEMEENIAVLKKKYEFEKKENSKVYLDEIFELYRILRKLIFGYADYWYFEMVIKNMKNSVLKEPLLIELKKQKKEYEKSKDYPRTKLTREIILKRLHAEGKIDLTSFIS